MPTLTSGISGHQYGIEADETSLIVKNFVVDVAPQHITKQMDKANNVLGRAIGALSSTITMEGELSASSLGVLAYTFTAACTVGNDKDYFGLTTGDVFMDRATVTQTFNGFKSLSLSLSRDAGVED